jgi:NADH:ubiquinone oxidoreductase subunit E
MKNIRICKEIYCCKAGSEKLIEFAENKTQSDSDIEVEPCGCLGECDHAPNLEIVNSETGKRKKHRNIKKGTLMSLIKKLRIKKK